jgi:hypothetical protein
MDYGGNCRSASRRKEKAIVPGLSIIIPAGDDVSLFEDTLAAVLRNRPRACEVIVPHAGTYADPYELASEVWFIELAAGATHGECLAHAIEKAAGDVLHVLSPGCDFNDGWWQPAVSHFSDAAIGCVAPRIVGPPDASGADIIGVHYGAAGRREVVASSDARERARDLLGPTHRAGFYRRTALRQIGGWPAALPLALADVDVGLSLHQLGYAAVAEPQSRISFAAVASSPSAYQRARQHEQLFWRHTQGALLSLAHPLFAVGECLAAGGPTSMLSALAGKVASIADIRQCRAHAARLKGLQRLTVTTPPPKSSNRGDQRRAA